MAQAHMLTWIACDDESRGRVQRPDTEGGRGERDIESTHARWWCVCVRMSDGAGEEDHSDTDREQEEGRKEIREPAEIARVGAGREGARGGQSER